MYASYENENTILLLSSGRSIFLKKFSEVNEQIISDEGKEEFGRQDSLIEVCLPFDEAETMSSGTLNGTLKRIGVTREELTLLGILLSNPNISLSEAGDRMGISKRTVSRIFF